MHTQLCLTLCNPMDSSQSGFSVHGNLQARIPEWVSISSSRSLPDPWIETVSPALAGEFFITKPPGKPKREGKIGIFRKVAGIGLFEKVMSEERPEDGLEASHVYFQMMISGRRKRQCNGAETNAARKLEWME